jgi:N-methylhydantoinase A
MDAQGKVLEPLDEVEARQVVRHLRAGGVEGIAIVFLHAYANPAHEQQMAAIVAEEFPQAAVSISSNVVREWREFERTSTTVLDVYVKPRMATYLAALERELSTRGYTGPLTIMQSSGGITSSRMARTVPIRTVESGPAGGVIGAAALGRRLNLPNLIAADVGGTTFDVALIADGKVLEEAETKVNRRPVLQPTLDIVSIGAGGGSIAWLDGEGGLRVGPRSAQANPGPACFDLGGTEPTVTDAQVLLGYLDPAYYLGQRMTLNRHAAETAIREKIAVPLKLDLIQAAHGICHLVGMNMTYAIRNVTIERGHDPREFSLACFGGGGGLFAGHLLNELECGQAIIPVNPANFSSWGLLNADYREDLVRAYPRPLAGTDPGDLRRTFRSMEDEARQTLADHGIDPSSLDMLYFADLRYIGQEHTVRVPVYASDYPDSTFSDLRMRFNAAHEKAYAHMLPEKPVEIVRLRLVTVAVTAKPDMPEISLAPARTALKGHRAAYFDGSTLNCPVYDRPALSPGQSFDGPLMVEEWTSTTLVLPGQRLNVDVYGNLLISRLDNQERENAIDY